MYKSNCFDKGFQSAATQWRNQMRVEKHEKFGKTLVLPGSSSLDGPRRQIDLSLNAIYQQFYASGILESHAKEGEDGCATNVPATEKKWKFPRNLFVILSRECRKHRWKNSLNLSPIGNCPDLNLHLIIASALGQKIDICAAGSFLLSTKICWYFHRNGDPAIRWNMFYTRIHSQLC